MDKIKWGILGTANIARYATIPGIKKAEHCELYAIAGRAQDCRRQTEGPLRHSGTELPHHTEDLGFDGILAEHLRRGAQGTAWPLPQASLAREGDVIPNHLPYIHPLDLISDTH